MSGAITASVAVGAYSSHKAAGAAGDAASQSAALQQQSMDESRRQFDIGQANLDPYMQAGTRALSTYEGMLAEDNLPKWGGFTQQDMQQDPGYQFRLEEGYQGLDRMSARAGQRMSGTRGAGLMDYGQRMASQEYGVARDRSIQDYSMQRQEGMDRLSQYSNLAASGQQAAGSMSTLGQNYSSSMMAASQNLGATYQDAGAAQAAGYLGTGSAIQGGIAGYQYQTGYNQPPIDTGASSAGSFFDQYGYFEGEG